MGVARPVDAGQDRVRDSRKTLEYGEGDTEGIVDVAPGVVRSSSNVRGGRVDKGDGIGEEIRGKGNASR